MQPIGDNRPSSLEPHEKNDCSTNATMVINNKMRCVGRRHSDTATGSSPTCYLSFLVSGVATNMMVTPVGLVDQ